MYNRYLDDFDGGSFVQLDPEPRQGASGQPRQPQRPGPAQPHAGHPASGGRSRPPEPFRSKNDLLKEVTGGLGQLLDGVKKHFSLEHFDTGDILLVLIILFLYLEDGDNLELVITLGLLLLLGLEDEKAQE